MAKEVCVVLLMAMAVMCVNSQGIIPGIRNICFEPVETGVCRAFIPAFYFNPLSGACDCFIYGGCRGNRNRFGTLADCMTGCSVRPELQFNTPACNRIFGEKNPLASFSLSPHQAAPSETRLPSSQIQQQPTGITQIQPEQPATQPQELTTQTKLEPAPQPQETSTQKTTPPTPKPVVVPATLIHTESANESEGESSSSDSSKSISSLIIGPSGVRAGTITIGQPVFVAFNIPKQENSNQPQQRTGSNKPEEQTSSNTTEQQSNDEEQEE